MYKKFVDDIRSIEDLETVINHYYPNELENKSMNCPFHSENTPSFKIADKGEGAFYKCFGCGVGGDIVDFVKRVENIEFIPALTKAYSILKKPLKLPKTNKIKLNAVNTNNINIFYEEKVRQAIREKDLDGALRYEFQKDKEAKRRYYMNFPFVDSKDKPQKIWENMAAILDENKIVVSYNEISKDIEVSGLDGDNLESHIVDIHSLCNKYGFKLNLSTIQSFVHRIAYNNRINPVTNFLNYCYEVYEKEDIHIQMLCDAIETEPYFNQELKKILIRKWLLNTACIAFNEGDGNTEGVLTLQGKQGIGKTRLIRKLIPMYVKTGLELDPSDKDKIYQCIKYWVCELGELDSTFKRDLSKLKAFITEQSDEFRRPYGLAPIKYPRKTSFYATVNNEEFLKDETGNRRYWVIPVKKINFELIDKIDIYKLWGEVMQMKELETETVYLNQNEMNMLSCSNEVFKVLGYVDISICTEFDWSKDKEQWTWKSSTDIAKKLYLKSTKGLRATLENYGGIYKKKDNKRGYITPPYKTEFQEML